MTDPTEILVIEDDPAVAASLTEGLRSEGYGTHWESTGSGGIDRARQGTEQLIILDVRLPDMSGFDVCRRIRALGLRQPVLMLTVQADEVDKVLGLEVGADDYLTKPYRLRELLARVRALIRRAYGELSAGPSDLLYAADLVIDRTRGRVTRGDRELALTPTEFRLLAFLASNPGQVFSKSHLIERVWGHGSEFYDENTVAVHVRRLREKIEADPGSPKILVTVPGLGYRLEG